MKTVLLAACSLLVCTALPAQNTSLVVWSNLAGSGTNCDPWTCVPAPVAAPRGAALLVSVAGAVWQPHFLLAALPPAQCVPVPGVTGALIVQPPVVAMFLPLTWGRIYGNCPANHTPGSTG